VTNEPAGRPLWVVSWPEIRDHLDVIAEHSPDLAGTLEYALYADEQEGAFRLTEDDRDGARHQSCDTTTAIRQAARLLSTLSELKQTLLKRPDFGEIERYREGITSEITAVATGAAGALTARMIDSTPAALRAEVAHLYKHGPRELIRASLATVFEDARILRDLAREAAGPFQANTEGEAAYIARVSRAELENSENSIADAWAYRLALYLVAYPEARPTVVDFTDGSLLYKHPGGAPSRVAVHRNDDERDAVGIHQTANHRAASVGTAQTVNINHYSRREEQDA
jgi:quinol monooxygenase YgiN